MSVPKQVLLATAAALQAIAQTPEASRVDEAMGNTEAKVEEVVQEAGRQIVLAQSKAGPTFPSGNRLPTPLVPDDDAALEDL